MQLINVILFGAAALVAAVPETDVDDEVEPEPEFSFFNGVKVPALLEIGPQNFDKEIKASKWLMVKQFSPTCPHCTEFAPTFQTLYEFYYTSTPQGSGNEKANFTTFYDFRFATINCLAYYDLCTANGVKAYPTTTLYKDGEKVQELKGVKTMKILSDEIEQALEKTKPGTRPAVVTLPAPGAKSTRPETASGDGKSAAEKTLNIDFNKPANDAQKKLVEDRLAVSTGGVASTSLMTEEVTKLKADNARLEAAVAAAESAVAKIPKETGSPKYQQVSYTPPEVKKPGELQAKPNAKGKSVSLTAETFQKMVTMTQDPWFIKFFAPWCQHCAAMAPQWEQLAKQMKGKLNVGEVNCDAESRLCKDVRTRGFPTMLFFHGGERVEYEGLRGLGDFIQYAEKALDFVGGVQDMTAESFEELEKREEVIFVYFYDHATTSEDFTALERLPLSLIGHAKLVKTRDQRLYDRFKITTWPRLLVSREGRPTYYNPLTPHEMRDVPMVLNWMKSVWLPIVPELTASNARQIMDGKLVVLGVLNRNSKDAYASAIREMKSAAGEWMDKQIQLFQLERQELRDAKQLRIEEAEDRGDQRALRNAKLIRINMDRADRKEVSFAWVDGTFWQRWIRTTYGIDVKDGERVIINDEDNRRYWDQTMTGNPITPSRTSILETLNKVTAQPPKIKAKLTISSLEKMVFDLRMTFSEHPFLAMFGTFGLLLGLASWFRGRFGRRRGGHFRLDDSFVPREFKGPLLGGNSNGKVD